MDKNKIQNEINDLMYFKKIINIRLSLLRFELQYDKDPKDIINKNDWIELI